MTWRPKKGMNSWQQVWEWRHGYDGFFHLIAAFANRIPQMLFIFFTGSENNYWKSVDKHGLQTWYAPHNLVRGLLHLIGGMTLVLVPFGMKNEVENGDVGSKTWFDILTWLIGQWGMIIWIFLML